MARSGRETPERSRAGRPLYILPQGMTNLEKEERVRSVNRSFLPRGPTSQNS